MVWKHFQTGCFVTKQFSAKKEIGSYFVGLSQQIAEPIFTLDSERQFVMKSTHNGAFHKIFPWVRKAILISLERSGKMP